MSEAQKTLKERAAVCGITLTPVQLEKFERYRALLLEWNQKMDLTAVTDAAGIDNRHFLDSLSLLRLFPEGLNGKICDIGTGAGFPSIPLKIMQPNLAMTLVDSLQKRISFLETVVDDLSLTDMTLLHERAEDFLKPNRDNLARGQFDFVVARAVAPLPTLLEYTLPALRIGGKLLAMKGPQAEEELKTAQNALTQLGGLVETIDSFRWTEEQWERVNICIVKVAETPARYPRSGGKAKKRPL